MINKVSNISFKSAILIRGPKRQVLEIENAIQDRSLGIVESPRIEMPTVSFPGMEYISPDIATDDMHSDGVKEVGLPKERFPFCMKKLGPDSDSVYFFATGKQARALDEIEEERINVIRGLIKNHKAKIEAEDSWKKSLLDELNVDLKALMQKYKNVRKQLEQIYVGYQHSLFDSEIILSAIKMGNFDFEKLSVIIRK